MAVDVLDFVRWNPSLLVNGNYSTYGCFLKDETRYCGSFYNQSREFDFPHICSRERVPTKFSLPIVIPTETMDYAPVPNDATINATDKCYDWYQTIKGDSCESIGKTYHITFKALLEWNPAIGADCENLWIDASYCVAGPNWGTDGYDASPTKTTSGGPPGPTQTGITVKCNDWYLAKSGDTCAGIAQDNDITTAQFLKWNPAVGTDCTKLLAGDAYCVGVSASTSGTGTATKTATTTKKTSTTKKPTSTSIKPPGPTQTGITKNCNKYAIAKAGATCTSFAKNHDITLKQLCRAALVRHPTGHFFSS